MVAFGELAVIFCVGVDTPWMLAVLLNHGELYRIEIRILPIII
jgi:hypothetical protein